MHAGGHRFEPVHLHQLDNLFGFAIVVKKIIFLNADADAVIHVFFDNLDKNFQYIKTIRLMSVVLWPSY